MNETSQQRTFVIEREIPGAGTLSPRDLAGIAQRSCAVLDELGPQIQWIHSYVTADRFYCIYSTTDPDLIRRHAERGRFPANRVSRVEAIIDPSTAAE